MYIETIRGASERIKSPNIHLAMSKVEVPCVGPHIKNAPFVGREDHKHTLSGADLYLRFNPTLMISSYGFTGGDFDGLQPPMACHERTEVKQESDTMLSKMRGGEWCQVSRVRECGKGKTLIGAIGSVKSQSGGCQEGMSSRLSDREVIELPASHDSALWR